MPPPRDRFTDYSAGPASYGRGRVSRTGLTGARGMQSPYRRTSGMQRPSPITPGTLGGADPTWTITGGDIEMHPGGMAPAPRSPITPGTMGGGGAYGNYMRAPGSNLTMADTRPPGSPRVPDRTTGKFPGGGQISTLMHGRPNITRPWPGPGGGGISAPSPSGEYGSGMGPMTAEEANEWLNAGNYTGGGYATIKANLAAENARRWGDAPGKAPAGNQLKIGPITPGSKHKHWTWGAPDLTPAGTAGTGTAGTGTAGGAKVPLTDPQTGLPLEDPQGNPITGTQSGQAAPPTGQPRPPQPSPYPRSPMTYWNQNAGGRAMRRRTAYGSSPYLNY